MQNKKRWIIVSSLGATLAAAGLITAAVLPAQANGPHTPASITSITEDGTNDGETADDGPGAVEDGTNDGETADDGPGAVEDGTNDGETADDGTGTPVEDGTNDGETADDGPSS